MDPLSDVLRAVRLNVAFFYVFEGIAPWSISVAPARELVPRVLPEAEHLMAYHIVTAGSCWIGCDGDPQVELHPGDGILFPHGDAHLASAEREERSGRRYNHAPSRPLERIRLGTGPGARVDLVCGFLGCDARPYNPLLAALPRSVTVRGIATGWLAEFPRQVVAEAWQNRAGGESLHGRPDYGRCRDRTGFYRPRKRSYSSRQRSIRAARFLVERGPLNGEEDSGEMGR